MWLCVLALHHPLLLQSWLSGACDSGSPGELEVVTSPSENAHWNSP